MTTNYFFGIITRCNRIPSHWTRLQSETLTEAKQEARNHDEARAMDSTTQFIVIGTDFNTIGTPIMIIRERRHGKWFRPSNRQQKSTNGNKKQ